jgi:hypothetical protein
MLNKQTCTHTLAATEFHFAEQSALINVAAIATSYPDTWTEVTNNTTAVTNQCSAITVTKVAAVRTTAIKLAVLAANATAGTHTASSITA